MQGAAPDEKAILFHPHLRRGKPGDKHADKVVLKPLPGFQKRTSPISSEAGSLNEPVRYGFRSFDRQWIIPDARLINQPNPELWERRSEKQLFATAFMEEAPTSGPAITFSPFVPDVHHYKGSFGGRVFTLWSDASGSSSNLKPALLEFLAQVYDRHVSPEDMFAYIAAVGSNPAYTARFQDDLSTPGLRIPITADAELFTETSELGYRVLWLHTFGERMTDAKKDRPEQPPRLPIDRRPTITKEGAISEEPEKMPDTIDYDAEKHRLLIGEGFIDNVSPAMWFYEVSGNQILTQ